MTGKAKKTAPPPLAWAIARNKIDMVEDLLRHGADFNERHEDLDALSLAVVAGHMKIAQLLINKGADVNAKSEGGVSALMNAVNMNRAEIVQLLLDRGADINASSKLGFTPLIYSVITRNMDVMRLLLERGADVSFREHRGYSAQDLAEAHNYTAMAELLKGTPAQRCHAIAADKQQKLNARAPKSPVIRRLRP